MIIVGVCGRSGSGKSIVSKILSDELNAEVISFDQISHDVLKQEDYKMFIKNLIGDSVFENNNINSKKLGKIIFNDAKKLEIVNKMAEVLMEKIIDKKLNSLKSEFVILDYALLPLMKYFKMCKYTILVTADESIRYERLKGRENISKEYFEKRENSYLNYDNLTFNFLVQNNGSQKELEKITQNIAKIIKFGGKNA